MYIVLVTLCRCIYLCMWVNVSEWESTDEWMCVKVPALLTARPCPRYSYSTLSLLGTTCLKGETRCVWT